MVWNKLKEDPENIRLMPRFKEYLTKSLDRSGEKGNEFSMSLGMYLPYLIYFEGDWVSEYMDRILPKGDELHLRYTISKMQATNYGYGAKFFAFFKKYNLATLVLEHFQKPGSTLNRLSRLAFFELFYHDKNALNEPTSIIYKVLENKIPSS